MKLFWYFCSSGDQFLVIENLIKKGVPKLIKWSKKVSAMSISIFIKKTKNKTIMGQNGPVHDRLNPAQFSLKLDKK